MPATWPFFTISAQDGTQHRSATRKSAASALVLADKWASEGLHDITLTDAAGISSDRRAFRATLPLIKRLSALENLH